MRQPLSLCTGLREAFRAGYGKRELLHDLSAGLVVGIVAIPLSMALAIASGVPPQQGLYTAIVAGAITAIFGGSQFQVSGPTAAFVVVLAPITAQHGLAGLMLASLMAGMILYGFGLAKLGRLIEFVPYPVTTGFTAGIAVVIATLQVKDLLGLKAVLPDSYLGKVAAIVHALPTINLPDVLVGGVTLVLLVLSPKLFRKLPGPVFILPAVTLGAALCAHYLPQFHVATINSQFSYMRDGQSIAGIPQMLPPLRLPWLWNGPDGLPLPLTLDLVRELFPAAITIAFLAAIESLLSAVIADGMTGSKHNPDAELMALGLGNIASTFFGGFAATGAIARTAANIRFGARSPLAAVVHAAVILLSVVVLAPWLGYLPIAALAALLLIVAWNMSEFRHFLHVVHIAPKSDVFVLLTCFLLTVIFDMVTAVTTGMMLASLLFIRRMAEVASVKLVSTETLDYPHGLRDGVLIYEIAGPLFFGAVEKAMSNLHVITGSVHTVILDFRKIPAMDVTGLINLDSALRKLQKKGVTVVLAGVSGQPYTALRKAGWDSKPDQLIITESFEDALREHAFAAAH